MPHGPPIPLAPARIEPDSPEFQAICGWPFADAYVSRLLQSDIRQRVTFGNCSVWAYREPGGSLVGFGTLDIAEDCNAYTKGRAHPYIPLLAINPTIKSLGYGAGIVEHLIDEATLLATAGLCHDVLFLDVYTSNKRAIDLYNRLGFATISPAPIVDPAQAGQEYIIMARRVSIGT